MTLLERFLNYVKIDSQSDGDSPTQPSTLKQFDVLKLLEKELKALGIKDVRPDSLGYLYGSIPSNDGSIKPAIGFLAHVDTAHEMTGKDVKPQVHRHYDGKKIVLNEEKKVYLDPKEFKELSSHQGKTLVTTDGTTLLGADDKAGCAIIMTFLEYVTTHPDFKHGPIKFAFTTDEEIGRGVKAFDVKKFGADFAYTFDGGDIAEINYENFNASSAVVAVKGEAIHPGSAKDKMINAQVVAMEFHHLLPKALTPERTSGYQGFIHMTESRGSVESAELRYIVRNHDADKLKAQEGLLVEAAKTINQHYGKPVLTLTIKPSYKNMKPLIDQHPESLDRAMKAYQALGLKIKGVPIRGGTDGANLSYMGVITPNLATGGYNYHGKYEYLVVEDAEQMVEIAKRIVQR